MSQEEQLRIAEAVLFAAADPLSAKEIARYLPGTVNMKSLLAALQARFEGRGITLQRYGTGYALRTAPDLAPYLERLQLQQKRLSRAALEVLAIIAYHQPVTRAEIEEIRAVRLGQGTLDRLLEAEWIRISGRREVAGRPLEYATTEQFLAQFHLADLSDLPDRDELSKTGFLDKHLRADSLLGDAPDDLAPDDLAPDDLAPDELAPAGSASVPPAAEDA